MNARMIRYTTKQDSANENQRLVENVFAEIADKDPGGVRYAVFRAEDGVSYVHVVIIDGDEDTLGGTAAFQEFQRAIAERWEEPASATPMSLVGSYRFVGA